MSTDPGEVPFRFLLRVRYGEVDAQKIVFNARWGDYIDIAVTEYQRVLFGAVIGPGSLDMRLVKQTTEWKGPAYFDDVIEARVTTRKVGTTSFTIATELRRAPDGPVLATSETVYVAIESERGTKIPVPQRFREALERGAPGVIVDASGVTR
jgi:acyl-CoA thioester hydrolase